ncbi:MAG: hypothetical protein GXP17_11190 [Gammaproteobacteria bacterium]|nr:hypothetical protein [Gammaproteobacteria bacterium]
MKWAVRKNHKCGKYLMQVSSAIIGGCFVAQAMAVPVPQKFLSQIDASKPITSATKQNQATYKVLQLQLNGLEGLLSKSIDGVGDAGALGQGFDTFRELNRGYCMTGQEREIPSRTLADISIDGTYTHERLVRDISRSASGSFSYSAFSASASSEFSRYTVEDDKSLVFIYKNRFFGPVRKFTNFSLDTAGAGQSPFISGDWTEFRKRCGDRFLEELQIGGGLYYSIKLVFNSLYDKQTIKRSGNASFGSFSASGSFKKTIETTRINGQIVIRAIQSGGDVTGLGRLMLDSNSGGADAVVSCNFNDMTACQKFIGNMITYAGATFPDQLAQTTNVPNVIGYGYLDYATLGAPDVLPPPAGLTNDFVNDPVWIKRRELAQEATELASQIDNAIALETLYGSKLDSSNKTIVSNIRVNKLEKNHEMLSVVGAGCWHYPASCLNSDTNMRLNLVPLSQVDQSWLEFPDYLSARYFSIDNVRAYYTSGNGDYCAAYDRSKLSWYNSQPKITVNLYPIGKYYNGLNFADREILRSNMDKVADCARPTDEIYRATAIENNGVRAHPYGCINTTKTLKFFGRTLTFSGPLSCANVLTSQGTKTINKNCSSGELGFPRLFGSKGWSKYAGSYDTSNTVRCL